MKVLHFYSRDVVLQTNRHTEYLWVEIDSIFSSICVYQSHIHFYIGQRVKYQSLITVTAKAYVFVLSHTRCTCVWLNDGWPCKHAIERPLNYYAELVVFRRFTSLENERRKRNLLDFPLRLNWWGKSTFTLRKSIHVVFSLSLSLVRYWLCCDGEHNLLSQRRLLQCLFMMDFFYFPVYTISDHDGPTHKHKPKNEIKKRRISHLLRDRRWNILI